MTFSILSICNFCQQFKVNYKNIKPVQFSCALWGENVNLYETKHATKALSSLPHAYVKGLR